MKVERGISFKEALQKMNTDYLPGDGFCISNKVHRSVTVYQIHARYMIMICSFFYFGLGGIAKY